MMWAKNCTRSYVDTSAKPPCAPDAPHAAARLASMAHIGHQKAGFAFKIISFHPNNIFLRLLGYKKSLFGFYVYTSAKLPRAPERPPWLRPPEKKYPLPPWAAGLGACLSMDPTQAPPHMTPSLGACAKHIANQKSRGSQGNQNKYY